MIQSYTVVDLEQGSQEWLDWRLQGITATESGILTGKNDHITPYQLFCLKEGLQLPEDLSNNPHVKRGNAMEPLLRVAIQKQFADELGDALLPLCLKSLIEPALSASLDGISKDIEPVEMKAPCESVWDDIVKYGENSEPYGRYWSQVQHQMFCLGAKRGHLIFGIKRKEGQIEFNRFLIHRDDKYLTNMVKRVRDFQTSRVQSVPPELDPKHDVYVPEANRMAAWVDVASRMTAAEEQIKWHEEKLKVLKEAKSKDTQTLELIKAEFSIGESAGVRVTSYSALGKIDWERLVKEQFGGVDSKIINQYRGKTSNRARVSFSNRVVPKNNVDPVKIERVDVAQTVQPNSMFF